MIDFQQINVWGAVAGALAAFALGGFWFSPLLFGKVWAASVNKRPEELGSPIVAMSLSLVTALVQVFLMAILFQVAGIDTTGLGLLGGLLLGLVFFLASLSDAVFTGVAKARWWWIQAAYRFLAMLIMCAIVGASAPENRLLKMKRNFQDAGASIEKGLKDLGDSLK